MPPRADLHTHTIVSDGTLTPRQLVRLARDSGLAAIAVTDHDHTGGLEEARDAGREFRVEVVTGIELSVEHQGVEAHLLGYLFDDADAALLARLEALRNSRATRALRILERLEAIGVSVRPEDVAAEASEGGAIGRPHVARVLMREGHVASVQEAFDKYLAEGRRAFVPKEKLTARHAIGLLHAAGGVAVLAHAVTLPDAKRDGIVRSLAAEGLDGLEVWHSKHDATTSARLQALADELGLVATGGSDFHGDTKPGVALGSVTVGTSVIEALRDRRA